MKHYAKTGRDTARDAETTARTRRAHQARRINRASHDILPSGNGWCWECHEAGEVQAGHFLCARPRPGYEPGALEEGGWTAHAV